MCIVIAVLNGIEISHKLKYLRQKWWYLHSLFATEALSCDVCSGVKLHTQLSCGLPMPILSSMLCYVKGPCIVVVWLGSGAMSEKPAMPIS